MSTSTDAYLMYGVNLPDEIMDDEGNYNVLEVLGDGLSLERHCCDEETMYILAIEGTVTRAWRGYPKKIDPSSMTVGADWDERLKAFCEKHKIETVGEPGWWLASWWG